MNTLVVYCQIFIIIKSNFLRYFLLLPFKKATAQSRAKVAVIITSCSLIFLKFSILALHLKKYQQLNALVY